MGYLFTQTPLRFITEGLWRDEAFSVFLAQKPIIEVMILTAKDFNPPLYYFILHLWMMLFGSSELSIRSISVFFFCVGIFAIYELFRLILKLSHIQSALYTLLVGSTPLLVFYAFEGRMYSMLFCFSMLSTLFLLRKQPKAYFWTILLGIYSHYFMILIVISQFVYLCIAHYKQRHLILKNEFIHRQILAALLFLPWILFVATSHKDLSGTFWIESLKPGQAELILGYLFSGIDKDFWAPIAQDKTLLSFLKTSSLFFVITIAIGIIFRVRTSLKTRAVPKEFILFMMSFIIPILILLIIDPFKPLFVPRYMIAATAMLSLSVVVAISYMPRLLKIAFIAVFIYFSFQLNTIQMTYRHRGQMRALSQEIKPMMQEDDVVYVTTELDLLDGMYYFGQDKVFLYGKTYADIPEYVGKVIIPESAVAARLPNFPKKAFVISNVTYKEYKIQSNFNSVLPQ